MTDQDLTDRNVTDWNSADRNLTDKNLTNRDLIDQEWCLDTPAVCVDLDILDANLRKTAERAKAAGVKLRPHVKTHKSVWIAKEQLRYGASGITVAKLGEAEVMVHAGIDDVLVAFPIVGAHKLKRLKALLEKARIIVSVDHVDAARGLSDLGVSIGKPVPLYVDVNSGLNRCGREPGEASAELVLEISRLPGVEVIGLMTHAGHAYGKTSDDACREVAREEAESLLITREALLKKGFGPLEISVGSTPTSKFVREFPGITEMRPGAYVFGDVSQLVTKTIGVEDCAMRIYATVVSKPRPGTVIIDAGSKTLANDTNANRPGFGFLPAFPDAVIERLNEEHGIIRMADDHLVNIGDRVEIIPNHCCTVTNLRDELVGMRGGKAERIIPVDARGKIK